MRVRERNTSEHRTLLSNDTSEQVDDMIAEQKAIPELRFKFDIFKSIDEINLSEESLSDYLRINHHVNTNDQALFECKLVKLFNQLKFMILAQSSDEKDNVSFNDLLKLEYNTKRFNVQSLFRLKNYLLRKAHELNLTNLLKKEGDAFDEFKF